MLSQTTLSCLAQDIFVVSSDIVYKPTLEQTDIKFLDGQREIFLKPFGSLDDIERFDIEDRFRREGEVTKKLFLEQALSYGEDRETYDSSSRTSFDLRLRKIVRYIFFKVFPGMYCLGAAQSEEFSPEQNRLAVQQVFDRLRAKFGPVPTGSEDVVTPGLIKVLRDRQEKTDFSFSNILSSLGYFYPADTPEVFKAFPADRGKSLLSEIFQGDPYLVLNNEVYQLRENNRSNPRLITPRGVFGLYKRVSFDIIQKVYLDSLKSRLLIQALDEFQTGNHLLEGRVNSGWYIDRAIEEGYFEWDFVGFFVSRAITQTPTCYAYRRIKKFALVDPYQREMCIPFGETRVGQQIYCYSGRLELENRPVIIDYIGHPAGHYNSMGFRGICNDRTFEGDVANRISEGIAALRHSARRGHSSFDRRVRIPVRQAVQEGFEIFAQ